jgi:hypothetical protein
VLSIDNNRREIASTRVLVVSMELRKRGGPSASDHMTETPRKRSHGHSVGSAEPPVERGKPDAN